MQKIEHTVEIEWSVWDSSSTVSWNWHGKTYNVTLKSPPLAVSVLSRRSLIAVVGNHDEQGSENLRLYTYDGVLNKTYNAPAIGDCSQFGGVQETDLGVEVVIGYFENGSWREVAGELRLDDGAVGALHRVY